MSNAEQQPALPLDATKIAALLDEHGGDLPDALEAAIDCYVYLDNADECVAAQRGEIEYP